jgi:hypothetical protein
MKRENCTTGKAAFANRTHALHTAMKGATTTSGVVTAGATAYSIGARAGSAIGALIIMKAEDEDEAGGECECN